MPKPENIVGKGFDKNPQNINRDGTRRLIGTVNQELQRSGFKEATRAEITSLYLRLMQLPLTELTDAVKDETNPIIIRVVGKAILSGKGFEIIEKILDRTLGKSTQPIELQQIAMKHTIEFVKFSDDAPVELE